MYIVIVDSQCACASDGFIEEIRSFHSFAEAESYAKSWIDSFNGYPCIGSARIFEFNYNKANNLDDFVSSFTEPVL